MADGGVPFLLETSPDCGGAAPALRVLLVNAMGDAALALTERRFQRFLQALFPNRAVVLRCTAPNAIARGEMAAARIARQYESPPDFSRDAPDLVVFSGAEPCTPLLQQEPFWPEFCALFDAVERARIPAIFSCLSAHAAALHFTGVERRRLKRKIFGMFAQEAAALRGAPARFAVAHSRWNALDEGDLLVAGYWVLSRGSAGVDAFAAAEGVPHLYLQGHPEYEASALDGEYRRDLKRHAAGQLTAAPAAPDMSEAPVGACGGALAFCRVALGAMMPAAVMGGAP